MIKSRLKNTFASAIWCFLFLSLAQFSAAANPPSTNCNCYIIINSSSSCAGSNSGSATAQAFDGRSPYTYRWSNGASGASVTGLASGTYRVTSTDKDGCTATQSVTISSVSLNVDAGANKTICKGSSTQLNATGADLYSWTPTTGLSNPSIANPVASPTVTTTYTVTGAVSSGELVTNGNFESGNTGFTSQYKYNSDLYPEGRYFVGSNANNYHSNFFGTGRGGSGKFMIVNGATVAGVDVWKQTVSVTPNTTYYFSTWITALNNLVSANLAFKINGTLIGPVISSPTSPNTWIQFYAVWNSGSATSATISIVNQNTIANGNDFGLDDISFNTVCEKTDQVTVTVKNISASAGNDKVSCSGESVTLTATGGGTYLWSTGATTASITVSPTSSTTYTVTVTNNGCSETDEVEVAMSPSCPDWEFDCANRKVEIVGKGAKGNTSTTLNFSNISNIDSIVVEAVCKNSPLPTSATFTSNNGQSITTTNRIGVINSNGNQGIFRVKMNAASSISVSTNQPNQTYSVIAYVYRSGVGIASGGSGVYTNAYIYRNNITYTLTVPATAAPKNLTITVPITEMTNDSRVANISATAGSVTNSTSINTFNLGNSLNIVTLPLNNVPGNVTSVSVTITSPNSNGDSFLNGVSVSTENCCGAMTATIAKTDVSCDGICNGTATASVTNGTAPFTYAWSNGDVTATADSLCAGSYSVTVTDANGCTATAGISLPNSTQPCSGEACYQSPDDPNVYVTSLWTINWNTSGVFLNVRTTLSRGFVDNTYGANAVNWPGNNHTFNQLVGSDHLILSLYNRSGVESMKLKMDYISASSSAPSGYACLGVSGGDGQMQIGNASDVVNVNTSLADNFNLYGYVLTTNSPATDTFYTPNPTYPNWIYDVWYEATVKLSAFGSSGFGYPAVTGIHASPSKTGNNSEDVVPGPCCDITLNVNKTDGTCLSPLASATAVATSSFLPITYVWSNGTTGATATGLVSDTYTVIAIDSAGCTADSAITVVDYNGVNISLQAFNEGCLNKCDGRIELTVSGGVGPYTYAWSNGATTKNILALCSGQYTVTVTDAQGCSASKTGTITAAAGPIIALQNTNVYCPGNCQGNIDLTIIQGQAPITFLWSDGSTQQDRTGLCIGQYCVTVTDASGCSTSNCINITEFSTLSVLFNITQPNNSHPGAISTSVYGGTAPYTYLWSNGSTASALTNVASGAYGVTVTDANGAVVSGVAMVNSMNQVKSGAFIINMGVVPQTMSNGLKPYGMVYDLVRNYNVPVKWVINPNKAKDGTDFTYNGVDYKGGPFIIEADYRTPAVDARIAYWQSQGVVGVTTTADITVPVYDCITGFSNLVVDQQNEQLVLPYFSNAMIPSSIYRVGLPSDLNGCDDVYAMPHADPEWSTHQYLRTFNRQYKGYIWSGCHAPSVLEGIANPANPSERMNFLSTTGLKCYGGNKCGPLITESHGNANTPYTYDPAYNSDPIMQFMGDMTPSTENGSEEWYIPLSNGRWNTNTAPAITTNNGTAPGKGVKLVYGPGYNDYNFGKVMYEAGHTANGKGPITSQVAAQRAFFNFILSASIDKRLDIVSNIPSTFISGTPQTLSIQVTGGVAPYTYAWSTTCAGTFSSTNAASVTFTPGQAPPQSKCALTVVVTDACGRRTFHTQPIAFLNSPPVKLSAVIASTPVSCIGICDGTATVTASGGTAPYTYTWSNGATTPTITNLCAGSYSVTVKDQNNCDSVLATVVMNPDTLKGSIIKTDVSCAGGNLPCQIFAYAPGSHAVWLPNLGLASDNFVFGPQGGSIETYGNGTARIYGNIYLQGDTSKSFFLDFHFSNKMNWTQWSALGRTWKGNAAIVGTNYQNWTYYIFDPNTPSTLTGRNSFVGNNMNIAHYPANLSMGLQIGLAANDKNGGYGLSTWFTHSGWKSGQGDINALLQCVQGQCDGTADVTVTGGTAPYAYSWNTGATSEDLSALCPGTYSITITDSKGCTKVLTTTILEGNELVLNATGTNIACAGVCNGTATVTATGGNTPFTYAWSNGATTQSLTGLCAGTYVVTVTDNKGCFGTDTVVITANPKPEVTAVATDVNCFGGSNGAVTTTVTGGTSPFTYAWSPSGETTANLANKPVGTYTVILTDVNGCKDTASATITQPADSLNGTTSSTPVSCIGGTDGTASVVATGGTAPYTYAWSTTPTRTTATITGLRVGAYSATITDAKGCIIVRTVTVTGVPPLTLGSLPSPVLCNGGNTGSINLTVSGGTPAYTFQWSNGATTEDISGLTAGNYNVTVTDANGCVATAGVSVTEPQPLVATATPQQIACFGGNTGSVTLSVVGGASPFTYAWSNGATTKDITGLTAGTYSVTVTDKNNCTAATSATVTQKDSIQITPTITEVSCYGGANGSILTAVTGGTSPYTYAWSNGAATANANSLAAGSYSVTVTDANGCTGTTSATVTQPADSLNGTTSSTPVSCIGGADGTATVVTTGGTAPYSYAWSTIPTRTTATITGLRVGTYSVTITDAKGCIIVRTVTVTGVPPLTLGSVPTPVLCNGGNTGSINLTVSGGTPGYTFQWSNGATTEDISGLTAGTYNVTVTDANGCVATAGVTVTEPQALVATATPQHIACFGANTGSVTLSVVGGASPFTYAWSNGDTTKDITGLTAGIYSVTITDKNNCTATASASVNQQAALTVTATPTDITCYGFNNGSIATTIGGGVAPYTYNWGAGQPTTANRSNLAPGSYSVTVTDANGCTGTASATITQPADSLNGTTSSTPVSCIGGTDGTASVVATGGTAPYTYAWSTTPTRTTATITGLRVGAYSATITDAKGCIIVRTVTVTGVPPLTLGSLPSPVLCNGGNTGSINLTVSGGTPAYTFQWSNGATTEDISGLTAGNYNVTVTDANGCVATAGVTVTEPQPLVATAAPQHIACFGGNTGSVTLSVVGGASPFTYAWSNGANTKDLTGLTAGTYSVTVTDKNNCTATTSATVTQQPALVVNVTGNNLACYNNNSGSAAANVTGGVAPYTYLWSNNSTTSAISNLPIGSYSVTVTDANNCTGTGTVTLTQPDSLEATISAGALACFGDSTADVTLLPVGGTAPYTYLWNTGATSQNLTNLGAGTYIVTITDANGCTLVKTAVVGQPNLLVATATPLHIACNGAATGGANMAVTGGTFPYTYLWSNGDTTQNLSGVTAGTYSVTVTDANGCSDTASATINQQAALQVIATPTNITCFGLTNGSITTFVNGGVAPYTYNWGGGITTANRSNLAPGTYTVTVSDANNCTGTASTTITQPADSLNGTTSSTPVSCVLGTDGTASVVATGGTAPYSYAWSTTPVRTSSTITGLRVGSYTVTITDANACNIVRTVVVTGVPPLTLGSVPSPVLCNGGSTGSINLTVSGGTPGYTFLWSNGAATEDISGLAAGNYNVTVTDANGCIATAGVNVTQPQPLVATATPQNIACFGANTGGVTLSVVGGSSPFTYAWSNGATTKDLSGLTAGTYSVTITDKNNCTATASATVNQQSALSVTVTGTDLTCFANRSGSATATVNGGVAPYSYAWSNGGNTASLINLPIGTYGVTVTDANGCTGTGSATISQPDTLTANASGSAVSCFGNTTGTVTLTVTGGTTAYTYAWSNGDTTKDLSGLGAGSYTVTVTDANGCTATASATVTQPALLTAAATGSAVSCFGDATGTVTLTVTGGTTAYSYAWSNGGVTKDLSGLAAGTYTVTVTDANGCTATASATVTEPALLAATGTNTNVLCNAGTNATAALTVSGGTTPYTYLWSNGATTQNLASLGAGTYTVTVTDANGCTVTKSYTVTQPATLAASATAQDVRCFLGSDGSVNSTVTGGVGPYTYRWSNNATTANLTALRAGSFTVTVTDANGCTATATAVVGQPGPLTLGGVPSPVLCNGGSTGSINLTTTGGVPPYTFIWSNGATTEDISNLTAGMYNVTVTDANNCVATVGVNVLQPAVITLSFVGVNVTTNGGTNGSIDLSVVGGTSPFTYTWSNGATTQDLTNIPAGNYCVTVTDVNGCTATGCKTITEPACTGFSASATGTNVNCNGGNNGTATATVTGGTAPYTYAWSNGATTQSLTGLAAGTYTVTVTDAVRCVSTANVTITQPSTLTAAAIGTSPLCSGQTNGSIALNVSGGTAPYTYAWSNGATTQNLNTLTGGTYSVTVTDANGCTATAAATITIPLSISIVPVATQVRCFLGNDGAVSITVTGGNSPYTYRWSNNATTRNITALRAGTYTVTVTDANGCTATSTSVVTQPGPLTLGGSPSPVSCFQGNDGSINLTATGGTTPYSFAWSNGATTEDITGLTAGTYNVTVTDARGCVATVAVNVLQPAAIVLSANVTDACAGGNSGALQLNVVGGTSPYTYVWSNGATTKNIGSLAPGSYAVTVTDSKGCVASSSFSVGSNVNCRTMEFTIDVFLEGPFESQNMLMQNKLRTQCNTVPLFQPYNNPAIGYTGTESVGSLGNDVVDWVLVSFRFTEDRNSEIYKTAALLSRDGKVRTIAGDTIFQVNASATDSLYVVVEHRNHMGVMTPAKLCADHANGNGVICVDFTHIQSYVTGNPATAGQKVLGIDNQGTVYGMHSGDGDSNFDINSSDFVPFGTDFNKFDIYSPGDFNMDCDCNSNDLPLWLGNFNQFSGVR